MIFYTHPEESKKTTQEHVLEWNKIELSNEKTLVGLEKKGDYNTQLYRDCS